MVAALLGRPSTLVTRNEVSRADPHPFAVARTRHGTLGTCVTSLQDGLATMTGGMMRWLVTGGAGFIGTNLVAHLIDLGHEPVIIDDLSRGGSELNAHFLEETYRASINRVDVSDATGLSTFLAGERPFDAIAHLAGQVSFLASLENPRRDFEVNALGTLNVLEHVRLRSPGDRRHRHELEQGLRRPAQIRIVEDETRYVAPDYPDGFGEDLPLDFHGPYGCSKGVADQYLADYGRMFDLRTASLRQSSVYGPHQHPRSDQGWVAHLVGEALAGRTDPAQRGRQAGARPAARHRPRPPLRRARRSDRAGRGHQLNVGGGVDNSLSILELFAWLDHAHGPASRLRHRADAAQRPDGLRLKQ